MIKKRRNINFVTKPKILDAVKTLFCYSRGALKVGLHYQAFLAGLYFTNLFQFSSAPQKIFNP